MSHDTKFSKKRNVEEVYENENDSDKSFLKIFMEESIETKASYENIITNLVIDLESKTDTYLNLSSIIDDFKKSLLNNREGIINRCLECGVDMGRCNPRQLCGKTICYSN
jgi:hypothetical protein